MHASLARPRPPEDGPSRGYPQILCGGSKGGAGCEIGAADIGGVTGEVVGGGVQKRLRERRERGKFGISPEKLREAVLKFALELRRPIYVEFEIRLEL